MLRQGAHPHELDFSFNLILFEEAIGIRYIMKI